jgi:DNA-binding NarL/FixJ family response regulator
MNICIAHAHRPAREVLERALHSRLLADVTGFACVEDVLTSTTNFDVFIVYSNLGHNMSGAQGAAIIREQNPGGLIIGVSDRPSADKKFRAAGADTFLLRSGNEISELVRLVQGRTGSRTTATPPA